MSEEYTSGRTDFGFRQVPEKDKAPLVRAIFDSVAARYDLMNDLMSAGVHRWWKAEMVSELKPRPGQRLLDVAGGTGDIALRALPRLAQGGAAEGGAVVCDVSEAMLAIGRARALDQGILTGIEWLCADAERLPIADRSVDFYTIGFGLRNVTRIDAALAEARRVLKPGGRFCCLEFSRVQVAILQPLYDAWSFRVLPRLGRMVAKDADSYQYLAESIRTFPDQERLAAMMQEAGFARVSVRNLSGGIAAIHGGWRL